MGILNDEWALVAEDVEGNQLSIVASGRRFQEALRNYANKSHSEQAQSMYIRGEIEAEDLERAIDRDIGIRKRNV